MPWSYSQLKDYEVCPHRLTLAYAKTPRASNQFADTGITAHSTIEDYITNKSDIIPPYPKLERDFILLKNANALSETKLGVSRRWVADSWTRAWGRAIFDAMIVTPSYIRIIDFKTGKPHTISHIDQAQTYALFADAHYPGIDIITEFWYLESGKQTIKTYTTETLTTIRQRVTARVLRTELDTKKLPRPNKFACGYCPYTNHCEYAHDDRANT